MDGMNRRTDLDPLSKSSGREPDRVRGSWLIGPLLLAAVSAGVLFVFRGPDHVFGIAFGLVLGLGFLWILVSTMFPSKPDRTCPQCGQDTLVRLDPKTTRGLTCGACAWTDASASSFYLAEDDGVLQDLVLRREDRDPESKRW